MRSGTREGSRMKLGVTKLNSIERARLMAVLHSKLGLSSHMNNNGRHLMIHDISL
jgi:hypothetical protein